MTPVGGASSATILWDSIDWKTTEDYVRRLQIRIAKAVREGRWGKVKALQRLLTHSHSAKLLAVKRVTQNRGRHTPGVDGTIWRRSGLASTSALGGAPTASLSRYNRGRRHLF